MNKVAMILAGVAAVLIVSAAAGGNADPPQPQDRMQGQVVAVRQQVGPQGQGPTVEIQLQTRTQERLWLQLGPASRFGDAARVGDRIRVRTLAGPAGEPPMIRTMRNYRSGDRLNVRDGNGDMNRDRLRLHDGTGSASQARQRVRDGGAGTAAGSGGAGAQGGGAASPGSGGRGGRR